MDNNAWSEGFDGTGMPEANEPNVSDDEFIWPDLSSADERAASFREQILRGSWPVRLPLTVEIYADGWLPQIHRLKPGQPRRRPDSQVITIELQLDRARIRELMLEHIHAPRDARESLLADLAGLVPVDRHCFLETATRHFATLLSESDAPLRHDEHLFGFVHDLHEFDSELIADLVKETIQVNQTAGARLRDVILNVVDSAEAREHLGWLATATITERLQEL